MLTELGDEMWRTVNSVRQPHLNRLSELGVSNTSLAHLGSIQPPFGIARVRFDLEGTFEPDENGDRAIITPVMVQDDFGLQLIDLIAWRSAQPRRWSWRTGSAWALGEDLIDDVEPVHVVSCPLDWMKAAGQALCILDWDAHPALWERLRCVPALIFSDDILRQRVRSALVRTARLPEMEIIPDAA